MEKTKILIIEDDPIIAADLQDRLEELGYAVAGPVASGEEALEIVKSTLTLDLVLMDIQLEGDLDGIETTRQIQKIRELPVIFLTSNSDDATFNQARSVNPQAFLSKPFRGRDLIHAIELAIRQSVMSGAVDETNANDNTFVFTDRIFIKMKDRMVRLFFTDILWVEADDYYCKVVTKEKEFLVTQTLKKFGEELAGMPELMRVHRSYIVNVAHVEEIGELYLHIDKGRIPFSKNQKDELMLRLKSV